MRERGTVVDFRGTFGFIKPTSGGLNVFVHQSDLEMDGFRELFKGDLVEFEYGSGDRGVKAIHVKVIAPAEETAAA
jgi:CspA family cold shock protein